MNHEIAHRSQSRRGATAVEFAVVAPIFFIVVFGVMETSRMIMVQEALTNAAREGCREAALATTTAASDVDTTVRRYLRNVATGALSQNAVRISTTPSNLSTIMSGDTIAVNVQVAFSDVSWLPGNFLGPEDFQITGRAFKRRE